MASVRSRGSVTTMSPQVEETFSPQFLAAIARVEAEALDPQSACARFNSSI